MFTFYFSECENSVMVPTSNYDSMCVPVPDLGANNNFIEEGKCQFNKQYL